MLEPDRRIIATTQAAASVVGSADQRLLGQVRIAGIGEELPGLA